MTHILREVRSAHPGVEPSYLERNTNELYNEFVNAVEAGRPTADILLSAAMALQTKQANDGFALPYRSPHREHLPAWAVWRNEAFAFSFEPIVTVYDTARITADRVPNIRYRLIHILNELP